MRRVRVRPPHSRAFKLLAPAALVLLALALTPSSFGVVDLDGAHSDQLANFDARAAVAPTAAQLAAASKLHGKVSWSRFGSPQQVFQRGGYLATGLRAPSAAAAARSWLAVHRQAFGLRSVSHLRLMTAEAMRGAPNFHAVTFRQTFGRALSADGLATVAVVKAKRGWKVVYASSSLTPDAALRGTKKLSPLAAWLHAARAAGIHVGGSEASVLGKTPDGALAVSALGVTGEETVKPIAFGTPLHGALRAYDTTVTRSLQGDQNQYRVIVDAATGRLLMRQSQTFNLADNPTWKGFQMAPPYNPMNAYPWGYPSTDTRDTFCWTATAGCTIVVGDNPATTAYAGGVASKVPWDVQLDVAGTNDAFILKSGRVGRDRILLRPVLVLLAAHVGAFGNRCAFPRDRRFLAEVQHVVVVRVAAHAHRHELDERRPQPVAGTIARPRERRGNRFRIGAVDRDAGHSVTGGLVGEHAHGGLLVHRCRERGLIVLDAEDRGELAHGARVDRLVPFAER
jgi:hypothetical protein